MLECVYPSVFVNGKENYEEIMGEGIPKKGSHNLGVLDEGLEELIDEYCDMETRIYDAVKEKFERRYERMKRDREGCCRKA